MLKNVKKGKILLSLIVMILMMVLFGNIYSLATEDNTAGNNPVTITPTTTNGNNTVNNTNTNNTANQSSIIAPSNNAVNNANVGNNTNTNNTANNNTSVYNTSNTSNSSSLPYTGTNSKAMLLIIVFAISSIYAYKKVSDYNV